MPIQLLSGRICSLGPWRVSLGSESRVLSDEIEPNPPIEGCSVFLKQLGGPQECRVQGRNLSEYSPCPPANSTHPYSPLLAATPNRSAQAPASHLCFFFIELIEIISVTAACSPSRDYKLRVERRSLRVLLPTIASATSTRLCEAQQMFV